MVSKSLSVAEPEHVIKPGEDISNSALLRVNLMSSNCSAVQVELFEDLNRDPT